ncbi:hypothetical protein JTE90_000942 [Oedothorax gibbosus]|uniref:Core Histone H2A/H2B/H3 domain-containing protein n=1 Tax=Oedothorax gibbosus TaxID=931172 RepID=A0AAV6U6F6_9ARAC|nr:hypothetical protein JTE90_000942 [Oedothorax gibbosus]
MSSHLIQARELRKRKQIQYVNNCSFHHYIHEVLRTSFTVDASISAQAATSIDTLLKSVFEDVGDAAKRLLVASKKRTLDERDVECAVRMTFKGQLSNHAVNAGKQCLANYLQVVTQNPADD